MVEAPKKSLKGYVCMHVIDEISNIKRLTVERHDGRKAYHSFIEF